MKLNWGKKKSRTRLSYCPNTYFIYNISKWGTCNMDISCFATKLFIYDWKKGYLKLCSLGYTLTSQPFCWRDTVQWSNHIACNIEVSHVWFSRWFYHDLDLIMPKWRIIKTISNFNRIEIRLIQSCVHYSHSVGGTQCNGHSTLRVAWKSHRVSHDTTVWLV